MNIIVKPYGSPSFYCRPDTTWERENKDLYLPEGVGEVHWTPVVFARISKAGKCIGERFVQRYYDSFNFGMLMYCMSGSTSDIAFTSCTDHTSILPMPLYNPVVLQKESNIYKVWKDGEEIFETGLNGIQDSIESAICNASGFISLRIGDFIAVELQPVSPMTARDEQAHRIHATFCDNPSYDLKVIF